MVWAIPTIVSGLISASGIVGMGVDGDSIKGRWVLAWIVGMTLWTIFGGIWSFNT